MTAMAVAAGRRMPVWGWILFGIAAAWLGVGTIAAAVTWAGAFSSANEFDNASICITASCDPSQLVSVTGTVTRTGQDKYYWVDLSGLGKATPQRVNFSAGGIWPLLHPGDQVQVVSWHGEITNLSNDQASSETLDNPNIKAYTALLRLVIGATGTLAFAVFFLSVRSKRLRGLGQFVAAWILFGGLSYETLILIADESVFFPLPILFALVGLVMYTIVVVARSRRLRRRAAADARPARVP